MAGLTGVLALLAFGGVARASPFSAANGTITSAATLPATTSATTIGSLTCGSIEISRLQAVAIQQYQGLTTDPALQCQCLGQINSWLSATNPPVRTRTRTIGTGVTTFTQTRSDTTVVVTTVLNELDVNTFTENFIEPQTDLWYGSASSPCCYSCTIQASTVEVFYWTDATESPAITSFSSNGFVYESPSIYIGFSSLSAFDYCGLVGQAFTNTTIGFNPTEISTLIFSPVVGTAPIGIISTDGSVRTTTDTPPTLWTPVGSAALSTTDLERNCSTISGYTYIPGNPSNAGFHITPPDPCHPTIVIPDRIRTLDPAWGSCISDAIGGFYDPPSALTPVSQLVPTTANPPPVSTTPSIPKSTSAAPPPPPPPPPPKTSTSVATPSSPPPPPPPKTSSSAPPPPPPPPPPPKSSSSAPPPPPPPKSSSSVAPPPPPPPPKSSSSAPLPPPPPPPPKSTTPAAPPPPPPAGSSSEGNHSPPVTAGGGNGSPSPSGPSSTPGGVNNAPPPPNSSQRPGSGNSNSSPPSNPSGTPGGNNNGSGNGGSSGSAAPTQPPPPPDGSNNNAGNGSSGSSSPSGSQETDSSAAPQNTGNGAGFTSKPTSILAVGSATFTENSQSDFVFGSQTLSPGGPAVTIGGTTLSLPASGSSIIINGATEPIPESPSATPGPDETGAGNTNAPGSQETGSSAGGADSTNTASTGLPSSSVSTIPKNEAAPGVFSGVMRNIKAVGIVMLVAFYM